MLSKNYFSLLTRTYNLRHDKWVDGIRKSCYAAYFTKLLKEQGCARRDNFWCRVRKKKFSGWCWILLNTNKPQHCSSAMCPTRARVCHVHAARAYAGTVDRRDGKIDPFFLAEGVVWRPRTTFPTVPSTHLSHPHCPRKRRNDAGNTSR